MATPEQLRPADGTRRGRPAFTLTEVLISIALVLVLILGINQVFAMTSRAVGAGQALSTTTRSARAAQAIITGDLSNAVIDRAPFFYIKSSTVAAFRNKVDQQNDHDYTPTAGPLVAADRSIRTLDRDNDGSDADARDLTPRQFLTSRTHRVDMMKVFVRSPARRQTGDGNSYSADASSDEQYVIYGHLSQPDNSKSAASINGQGQDVGIGTSGTAQTITTNPNNFYASDWILGRFAFLLRDPEVNGSTRVIRDRYGNFMTYYARPPEADSTSKLTDPFSFDTGITQNGPVPPSQPPVSLIQNTQFDLIGMSMERYREDYFAPYTKRNDDAPNNNGPDPKNAEWATNPNKFDFRATGSAKPIRPLSRVGVSRTTPCFVEHCTQFVVEFAGDFLKQDPTTGAVTGVCNGSGGGVDGEVDFIIDPVTQRKSIRWYGFPRDVNNDGRIRPDVDVVPVRDIAGIWLPFERKLDNLLPKATGPLYYDTEASVPLTAAYYAVWGPDTDNYPRPKMVRVTMAVDDPAGRIGEEQYFSYVVQLN